MPSSIEWTDETWNPLRGCSRVSEGCRNCYAEVVANRFSGKGQPYEGLIAKGGQWNGTIKLVPEKLLEPWHWVKPRMIFVNSMSDLFHPAVPFEYIAAVFFIMSVTSRHTYQVLTKRPERMLEFFRWAEANDPYECDSIDDGIEWAARRIPAIEELAWKPATAKRGGYDNCGPAFPYENVWLGVSVEDQATAEERIPLLLQVPAAVRWISAEPLLAKLNILKWIDPWTCSNCDYHGCEQDSGPERCDSCDQGLAYDEKLGFGVCQKCGAMEDESEEVGRACPECGIANGWSQDLGYKFESRGGAPLIDWVVAGGESGPNARPVHPDWVRSLRGQCNSAGTPFFFKQWGEYAPNCKDKSKERVYVSVHDGGFFSVQPDEKPRQSHLLDRGAMQRVGKKKAGRTLDGREWSQYPVTEQAGQ